MTNTVLLLIVAGLLALFGGFSVVKGMQSVRAARQYPGALIYWDEPAVEGYGRDPGGWLAVFVHRLALVLLGALAVFAMFQRLPPQSGLFTRPEIGALLADLVSVLAVTMIGFTWGVSFFGPFAERLGGPHHYALSAEGILIGGNLLPWSAFNHFDLDTAQNLVYIWSATLPGSLAMVAAPSEPGAAARLAAILQEHLPDSAPTEARTSGRWTLAVRMALLCLAFLAPAAWLTSTSPVIMLLADAFLMCILQFAGAWLIDHLLYGDKARPVTATPYVT